MNELAERANEARLAGRLAEAVHLFEQAEAQLPAGVEGLARARWLTLRASLDRDQLRFVVGLERLRQAKRIYRLHGAGAEVARCELKVGILYDDLGDFLAAREEFVAAYVRLPPGHLLRPVAGYNLVASEIHMGNVAEARAMFEAMRPAARLMAAEGDRLGHCRRVDWIEAEILLWEGCYAAARALFTGIAASYAGECNVVNATRALVDLAECAQRLGDFAEVERLELVLAQLLGSLGSLEADAVCRALLAGMAMRRYSEAAILALVRAAKMGQPCAS